MSDPMEQATAETEQPKTANRLRSARSAMWWLFVLLVVACAVVIRVLPMNTFVRAVLVSTALAGCAAVLLSVLVLISSRPGAAYPAIFVVALFVTWAVLANKPPYKDGLRELYHSRLKSFVGVPFRHGGETTGGIDSPGLARAAFWQAIMFEGMRELNPRLLGPVLWRFWWRDVGGRDLLRGRHGYTKVVGRAPRLAGYDTYMLEVGDMAVIDGGAHVMVFYGGDRWIEANPGGGEVAINTAPADSKRPHFSRPVTFVRWWLLAE